MLALFIFQYKEKRMAQEKDLLQNQVTWLNTELKAKSEELLSLSRQKGSEILELQCNLNNKEDEVLTKPISILCIMCILSHHEYCLICLEILVNVLISVNLCRSLASKIRSPVWRHPMRTFRGKQRRWSPRWERLAIVIHRGSYQLNSVS